MLSRMQALSLLDECTGRDLWPLEHCRKRGVPEVWIEELADAFESSFDRNRDTIYFEGQATNQFHGIRDVDLAIKLGELLGVRTREMLAFTIGREAVVTAIKEAVEEG